MVKKRIGVLFLIILMSFVNIFAVNISAVSDHSYVSIESKSVAVGDTFDVYFHISNYNNINTIGLRIEYDEDMLQEITDVSSDKSADNVLLIKDSFIRHYDIKKGIVTYGDSNSMDKSIDELDGKILKLSFVAIKEGKTNITCEVQEKTVSKQSYTYYASNGVIDIVGGSLTQHTHTLVYHEAKVATCYSIGNIEYWHCLSCNKKYMDQFGSKELVDVVLPISKLSHEGGTVVKDAIRETELNDGYSGDTYCLGCGEMLLTGYRIPALDESIGTEFADDEYLQVTNTTPWNNPFLDVSEDDLYYHAIRYVYETGLFKGISENEFAPDTTMTRAMFVTVLGRLAEVDTTYFYFNKSEFNDVVSGEWYAPYVEWASESGIINGYGDGRFGVNDTITIEQAAVIMYRYASYVGLSQKTNITLIQYNDEDKISEWAHDALKWVIQNGVYTGNDYYIYPKDPAKRSLVAEIIYAFVTKLGS